MECHHALSSNQRYPIHHEALGHKNIKNAMIYTQLIEFGAEEEYHVRVARTLKEACELAKAGFEYFTEIEGAHIFRKRR